jgi:hypothetical protein
MMTNNSAPYFANRRKRPFFRRLAIAIFATAFCVVTVTSQAAQLAFSDFGPGNTYGNFGQSIGGQFINGYNFTSAAAGAVSEIDVGIGGAGTFNLNLYTDNAGALGSSIWSASNIPVGLGSPNPAVINVLSGPTLASGQNYWLVASGPSNSAYWSPNTIGATGTHYHHDSGSDSYVANTSLGAFAVSVVPEPASLGLFYIGLMSIAGAAFFRARDRRRHD